ncbi:hypothetical protein GCM10007362_41490 [Saccharibacillus endophyticus]|uniref:Uncharacterized protein n=1 Tax=Saccharibacillus endophyticus TaxID=2060666 RepID=A0ABQ2A2R9_9BACL|nr:hypothetical protein GCM10007362_41490 [Saccharibacillus endophyticus]
MFITPIKQFDSSLTRRNVQKIDKIRYDNEELRLHALLFSSQGFDTGGPNVC